MERDGPWLLQASAKKRSAASTLGKKNSFHFVTSFLFAFTRMSSTMMNMLKAIVNYFSYWTVAGQRLKIITIYLR